jgi:two-component system, LuxR family, response regulator FixJ
VIAIVDDDNFAREGISSLLLSFGYTASRFASAEEFLASGLVDSTTCLIADVHMPRMSGLELQKRLNEERRCPPIIFLTGYFSERARAQALEAGAVAYFGKPLREGSLIDSIKKALDGATGTRTSPCYPTGNSN